MKIFYLITKSEIGGAQTHLVDLCRYFHGRGHEILVMSGGNGWLKEECDKIGVRYQSNSFFSNSVNPLKIYQAIREIKKCANGFKPDIVHCHSSAAAFLGRLAIKGKIKTIYTAHGWGFNVGMNQFLRYSVLLAEKAVAKFTDKYICVSEFVKKLGLKYSLASENKFTVIYNGVKTDGEEIGLKNNDKINLIFVGRLAEPKKPEMVIEAIDFFPQDLKNKIKFTIVGDGPKKEFLQRMVARENVEVDFKGTLSREKSMEELCLADVFVFISAWEGFPYTILEAMSVGLPVVASNVGGVAEVVSENNGFLIKNEICEISEVLLKLVNNKELRLQLGQNGKDRIKKDFSLEKMLDEIDKVYVEMIKVK
ncbi:MAG: hypothetical protein COU29_04150 [Candidatus Magasanikbacteria bacterium CG10_big_fil_rev_8_21_14_0_10_36_32]|uniref:Glycosyltransferase family 1 protein n=1 Tax=Candidatus Magasanikbacteria bacterium CG10_big_fil_rev_8_21_14_0_10_36_32 TaxID=1974646 RepID=A0A2M6W619_9BACT|nr:MAG: hypothetical protein COU29_04150 [Candidatus Magasanikbacteria bacterium CG10_big_fil_rev_8_21_14_0_10_36_32]